MNDESDSGFIIAPGTPPAHPRAGRSKYPLDQLQAGECMTVTAGAGALRQAVRRYRLHHSGTARFTVREGVGGVSRVYRLA